MAIDFDKYFKIPTPLVEIREKLFDDKRVRVFVKRDDLCHADISGNKFRKLKYILEDAKKEKKNTLLTFGGAFSNHIRAVAEAGYLFGFKTVAYIRGEELHQGSNSTLAYAHERGMELIFVSREDYRNKEKLAQMHDETCYVIPEGGSSKLALSGVSELIDENLENDFTHICTAVGTGGTMAGLLSNMNFEGEILGFAVLKDAEFLKNDIMNLLGKKETPISLQLDYNFGGYAKHTPELINFCLEFEKKHNIPLEQIYTGKMMYGFYDLVQKNHFKSDDKIMLLHTGGLQGRCF
jgi:1-aminocyclopropane-1-carboxylate deaminase